MHFGIVIRSLVMSVITTFFVAEYLYAMAGANSDITLMSAIITFVVSFISSLLLFGISRKKD